MFLLSNQSNVFQGVDKFVFDKELGAGQFGKVMLAKYSHERKPVDDQKVNTLTDENGEEFQFLGGQKVAIKAVRNQLWNKKLGKYVENQDIKREIAVMTSINALKLDHVVKLYQVIERGDYTYLVMEYFDGKMLSDLMPHKTKKVRNNLPVFVSSIK